MNPDRRRLLVAALAGSAGVITLTALAACGRQAEATPVPAEVDSASTCDLDGMLLADYPGPKAQLYYLGDPKPHWCCDTVEMFNTLLKPEQARQIRAVSVQDMALADWDHPRGHWFDARTGYYVFGSRRHGSMGPTVASFRQEADARTFMARDGGKLLRYAEVTPEMVDLSGGAQHDGRM
jgi:copper chaperone NosL